jgi:hypothetical protein
VETEVRQMTGTKVLTALKAREFRSEHIPTTDSTSIPFPGYHPGTYNDEIHNDLVGQYIFPSGGDVWDWDEGDDPAGSPRSDETYEALRGYVEGGQIWYVSLHNRTHNTIPGLRIGRHSWVVLFAVGLSPHGQRLIGLVSHQLCHNLCD